MSITLSYGGLQDTKDRDTPIRPSVKLAARWDGRNRENARILDFSLEQATENKTKLTDALMKRKETLNFSWKNRIIIPEIC